MSKFGLFSAGSSLREVVASEIEGTGLIFSETLLGSMESTERLDDSWELGRLELFSDAGESRSLCSCNRKI